jgi:hypothetical protein
MTREFQGLGRQRMDRALRLVLLDPVARQPIGRR